MTFNLDEAAQLNWKKMDVLGRLDNGEYDVVSVASKLSDDSRKEEEQEEPGSGNIKHEERNKALQASISKYKASSIFAKKLCAEKKGTKDEVVLAAATVASTSAAKKISKLDGRFNYSEPDDFMSAEEINAEVDACNRPRGTNLKDDQEETESVADDGNGTIMALKKEKKGVLDDGDGTITAPFTIEGQNLTSTPYIQKSGWDLDETSLTSERKGFVFTLSAIKLYKYIDKHFKEKLEKISSVASWQTNLANFKSLGFIKLECYRFNVADRVQSDGACGLSVIQLGMEWCRSGFKDRIEDLIVKRTLKKTVPEFAAFLLESLEETAFDQLDYKVLAENMDLLKKKLTEFRDTEPVKGKYPMRIYLEGSEIGCLFALLRIPAVIWVPEGPHCSWVVHCRTHDFQDKGGWKCVLGNELSGPNISNLLQNWTQTVHIAMESNHCKVFLADPPQASDFDGCLSEWAEALQKASRVLPSKFLSPVKEPTVAAGFQSPICGDSLTAALGNDDVLDYASSPEKLPFDIPPLEKQFSIVQERKIAGIRRYFRFSGEGSAMKLFKESVDEMLDKMYGMDPFSGLVSPKNSIYNFCYFGPHLHENPASEDEMWEFAREANVTDKITILLGVWSGQCRKLSLVRMHINEKGFSTRNISKEPRDSFRGFVCYPDVPLLDKVEELSQHYKDFVRCGKLLLGENPSPKVPTWAITKGGQQIEFLYPVYDPTFGGCDGSKLVAVNLYYYNILFQDCEVAFRIGDIVTFKGYKFLFLGSTEMKLANTWDKLFALLGALDGSEVYSCDKVTELERNNSGNDIVTAEKCLDRYAVDCLRQNKVVRPAQISLPVLKSMEEAEKLEASKVEAKAKVGDYSVTTATSTKSKKRAAYETSVAPPKKKKKNNDEIFPLSVKRKDRWHKWMTVRFTGSPRLFGSWATLHGIYRNEVSEPVSLEDFLDLRKNDPILRYVTRDEIHGGYTLDKDYLDWLQSHNPKKMRLVQKKQSRFAAEDSISSISDDLGDDSIEGKQQGSTRDEKKLEDLINGIVSESLKQSHSDIDKRITGIDNRITGIEQNFKTVRDDVKKQDARLSQIETDLNLKLDNQDSKLDSILRAIGNNAHAAPQNNFFSPNRSTHFGSSPPNNSAFSMQPPNNTNFSMPPPAGTPFSMNGASSAASHQQDNVANHLVRGQETEYIAVLRNLASHLEKKNMYSYNY